MKKYFSFPIAAFVMVAISLFSCTENIEIKTDNSEPILVIYGCLTNDFTYQTIRVSSSSPYFDPNPNPTISGADVRVTSSEGETILFRESSTEAGVYNSTERVAGQPGVTYVLTVETDFDGDGIRETYTATSTMALPVEVDSMKIAYVETSAFNAYELYIYAQDPPTVDYYLANYVVNDTAATDRISLKSVMKDDIINGQYLNGFTIMLFKDTVYEAEEGNDYEDDHVYLTEGNKLTLEFSRIDKEYYNFIAQCQREMNGENPFFGAPASNIDTNISGGATGFFTSYYIDRTTIIVTK